MADTRPCDRCGAAFTPRREHARFCSARCRVAWNRANLNDPADEASALQWSVTAMSDTIARFPRVRAWDRPRALGVVGEAVWWVTIVDATLVRHYPETYDRVMAGQDPVQRQLTEETLAGLRFVRNRIGVDIDLADFIDLGSADAGPGEGRITAWTWRPMPAPALESLSPRGHSWEMTRYQAYQARLAGHTIGEIFGRAASFLQVIAANPTSAADIGGHDVVATLQGELQP
jgi:endogenous inhibitor of DNA gyrase (YacG/DUF329 family)